MDVLFAIGLAAIIKMVFDHEEDPISAYTDTGVGLTTSYDISDFVDMTEVELARNIRSARHMDYRNGRYRTFPVTEGVYVDMNKEYMDIFTEFVTTQFFKSPECLFNFLESVCLTFDVTLAEYRIVHGLQEDDLFFIYKGGNVLRIMSNDFLKELPAHASKALSDKYEKYFGRSDCDFSIYVRPEIPDYDAVFRDITVLSYILQVKLRKVFMSDPRKYFDFFRYSTEYQKELLDGVLTRVKNSSGLQDPNNDVYYQKVPKSVSFNDESYVGRRDIGMQDSVDTGDICLYALSNTVAPLYISVNETLDFNGPEGSRVKFNLVRTKVAFNMHFEHDMFNLGGELIDISIPHKLEDKLINLFKHGVSHSIETYRLQYGSRMLTFRSYSLGHLTIDLETILFVERLPWDDPKYTKRIYRLFYLYIIDLFVVVPSHDQRGAFLEQLYLTLKRFRDTEDKGELISGLARVKSDADITFNSLLGYLSAIAMKVTEQTAHAEYVKMINVIIDNCENSFVLFDNLKAYCTNQSTVAHETLYNTDFKSLIGGSQK